MMGKEKTLKTQSNADKMKSWFAVYVRSRAEKKVAEALLQQGYEFFLPLKKTLRNWSDRKKWVDLPLIPGYCFVCCTPGEHHQILRLNHVVSFVRFCGQPAVIPAGQIDMLKRMLKQSDFSIEVSMELPEPGQKVEVISGPLIGMQAELVQIRGRSKVCIRIEQISNVVLVEIPLEDVRVIADR